MKRLFLSVIMVLGLSTVCFSQNKQEINDLNIEIPLPKLARYLNLNSIQYDNVENAIDFFSDKMQSAKYSKGRRQIKNLNEAIYGNLKLMKSTLSQSQYKKYLQLINAELKNRGLSTYILNISEI
jgi:hypothetical protein